MSRLYWNSPWTLKLIITLMSCAFSSFLSAADTPSPEFALTFKPTQAEVDYEIPDPKTIKQCKVVVERIGKGSGWMISGAAGQVLRRFVDSNDDKVVDQWRYYKDGVEVYRDIDTDFNKQVDQMRWFNGGGSRWGMDKNEDGRIDGWKSLSPEEASKELVIAIKRKDLRLLNSLLIGPEDLTRLGIKGEIATTITKNFSQTEDLLEKLAASKLLSGKAKWMQFQGTIPSLIPSEQIGSREDILAHQNVMAMVDNDGQTGLLQLGTMIQVGDVWKLTRLPQPLEGNSIQVAEDTLFIPSFSANDPTPAVPTTGTGNTVSAATQKLVEELQAIDKKAPAPTAGKAAWSEFNRIRSALLVKLIDASASAEEREQWSKQMIDGIAAGVQGDTYDGGLERLVGMLAEVERKSPRSPLVAYLTYRIMATQYSIELRRTPADKTQQVQEKWLKTLESFVEKFPKEEDSPEAMFQLGSTYEFAGKLKDARGWYSKLVSLSPQSPSGLRAAGALKRLDIKGEPFALKGMTLKGMPFDINSYRGKVTLVVYWANWSEPLVKDLAQLRAFSVQYQDRGLEIVGVNVDATKEDAQAWIAENNVNWVQLHEPGGLETSPLAVDYGIILLPTMFVIDRDGKVVYRGMAAEELRPVFMELMKSK